MKRLLTVFLLFLTSSTAWAGTAYYVDPTAAGGGTGTYASPWNSIAQVNAKAFSAGDDVYFKAGTTLTMTTHLLVDWHGTESDPVVIGAYYGKGLFGLNNAARPILLGNKITPVPSGIYTALIHYVGPGYVTVQDVHVKNSYGLGFQLSEGYYADGRRSIGNVVRNCITQDSGRQGILLARTSYSLVEDCFVDGASQTPEPLASGVIGYGGGGIEISGMNRETSVHNVVRGNTVRRAGESIGNYLGARYTIIENNIVYDMGRVGIYAANSRDGVIRNNIVYWNNPEESQNHLAPRMPLRAGLIHIDAEGHVATTIKVTGGWEIYGNYLAGGRVGIWLECNSNQYGVYQVNNKIHDNVIVDCDRNFWIHQAVTGWTGNEIYNNYSFLFTSGFVHYYADSSPIGVTFSGNHYNTLVNTPAGNAATGAVYDDPDLVRVTGWRDMPVNGSADVSWWDFVGGSTPPPTSESALNSANAYGGATYTPTRAFLFDDATGTTLTDHSAAGADATLTNPVWADNGLTMNATGQLIAAPVPSFGATWSVFWAWTSTEAYAGDYSKFWYYYNATTRDWQLERYTTDTEIRSDVGGLTDYTVAWTPTPDTHDQYFHTGLLTLNDTGNERCLYIDGNLQSCSNTAFASPTWTGNFYIGGKNDGSRIINATFHAFYIWPNVLTAADAAALHADYDQLFTDPPARTFNTPTPAAPGPLRRVTTTISTMPVVTTRSQ